jgi:hypothetical protein
MSSSELGGMTVVALALSAALVSAEYLLAELIEAFLF